MSTRDQSCPLLLLLDGLLSRDDRQICDALIGLHEAVQAVAPGLSLLPSFPDIDVATATSRNFVVSFTTRTLFSKSLFVQPIIYWTVTRTVRAGSYRVRDGADLLSEECGTTNDPIDDNRRLEIDCIRDYIDKDQSVWRFHHNLDLCQLIRIVLKKCPRLAYTQSIRDGSIALHFAASLGIVPIVEVIFRNYPEASTTPNMKGKIPLHYAAREGRNEVVDFFLRAVPGIASIATQKRKLALHFAAGDGHWNVCRLLLRYYPRGASLPSEKGKLPLHHCARWGHAEAAYDLINYYPDGVRALDWEGGLPLHDAAREGKVEMSRYLIELYPLALATANMRNEIPLFPAVRSGVLECVSLLVQAWPAGSRCILQNISKQDNVKSWMTWPTLELLLRGAVQKLYGCTLLDGVDPPRVKLVTNDDWTVLVQPPIPPQWELQKPCNKKEKSKQQKKKIKVLPSFRDVNESYANQMLQFVVGDRSGRTTSIEEFLGGEIDAYDIETTTVMRSKSPVLHDEYFASTIRSDKKRSLDESVSTNETTLGKVSSKYVFIPEHERKFIPLSAAFECSASCHVIRYVIDLRLEKDISETDERGMLPLHWAVTQCNRPKLDTLEEREMMIDMILNDLLKNPSMIDICNRTTTVRDHMYNRLPIHLAILYRADFRVIQTLINANLPSAVEKCATNDMFYDKTPLHMATQSNCELDVVYTLLRADPSFVSNEMTYNLAPPPSTKTKFARAMGASRECGKVVVECLPIEEGISFL